VAAATLHGLDRAEAGLVGRMLALAAGAWILTDRRMGGMAAGPGTELGDVGWFAVSWLLMMAAMMLPAISPLVVAYGRRSAPTGGAAAFAAGYLATWLAAGLLGYAAIEGLRSLDLGFLAWEHAGRLVTAAVIAGAGVYQLTTPKDACLARCRDRHTFLGERWRPGRVGALGMGVEHGAVCVGCCWALMAALVALGAMSLPWMALVAGLVTAERLLPWGDGARRVVAVVLVALATGVALAPGDVPGLTVPGSEMAMQER
jgi:predicted metal-binding membrane protein